MVEVRLRSNRVIPDPATDLSAEGDTDTVTVGEGVSVTDQLYEGSDGKFWKADASTDTTSKGRLVMATEAKSAEQSCTVLLFGKMRNDSWNWTPGEILYVSTTPGGLTIIMPIAKVKGVA
ncbi:hypothetical protein ES703_02598 [subsurface metagenome]